MRALPIPARLYIAATIAAGAFLLVTLGPRSTFDKPWLFAFLLATSALTSAFKVSLPLARSGSTMSVSYAVDFASLLLLGPNETMIVAVTSAWSQCTFRMKAKNPFYRTLFSMACLAVTVQAAGFAYEILGGVPGTLGHTVSDLARPLVAAATTYFVFNTCLIAIAVSLSTRQSFIGVWNQNFLWSAPSYFVGAGAAAIATWAVMNSGVWTALLAAAPVYVTYRSYKVYLGRIDDERRHVEEMADLHLATIEALALAIDAKDQTAQSHIRRVQVYATGIARGLGMSETEIQGVKTAALLHDIGKLAVPEHILSKPGPLTQEEFQKIRVHPQVGAEIISAVPFPYPVAPLILSHHERWDGKGYPQGLRGEEIPLGARILSVVDYFDALTSDRPYHKAMTHDAAVALLQQEAGRALDATVVEMFVTMMPEMAVAAGTIDTVVPRRLSIESTSDLGRPAVGFQPESRPVKGNTVFEDIALAHREIYALYEIAQTMGTSLGVADTMALISSKLSNLVPFSSCALFLYNEDVETLQCRFATGTEADVIGTMIVRGGQGLTGWVARNRRPLVNARPSAEFEAAGLTSKPTTLKSALVAPLVFSDRFIGTLAVYSTQPDFYTDDHRRLLDRVSEQASAVIHNSIVFEQTQEDSLTDPLTGLPNTRFMFMHLTRELSRAERLKAEVALLVMDLDSFKEINDSHGHHVGDRALREVATVLRAAIRPYDICIRYAGDEFIVVLSGCGADEAERKRVELQETVDNVFALSAIVTAAQAHGLRLPLLVRCSDVLADRLARLQTAFARSMVDHDYAGGYTAIYPIKVNQQRGVAGELASAGTSGFGLEAGSKPELMAVLALARPGSLVICNGYKDREYVRLALIGRQLGLSSFIVIEKPSELRTVIEEARALGVEPLLGVRIRLATIGAGKWQNTGGDKAKFGLSPRQLLDLLRDLNEAGLSDRLKLLHFHMGSQISNVRDIARGMREATRYVVELQRAGIDLRYVDVGGGLGVDYEGTRSRSDCSINYSMEQYASTIVQPLAEVCREHGITPPHVLTEAGRAMTAHHAVLVVNVSEVERAQQGAVPALDPDEPASLRRLREVHDELDQRSPLELYHEAQYHWGEGQALYAMGQLDLQARAALDDMYYAIVNAVRERLKPDERAQRPAYDELNQSLVDKYFMNFSVFESIPDVWAIDQVFPIVPLSRLDERPTRRAVLADLTCDSDGRIDQYVDADGVDFSLPVHELKHGEGYRLGIFMVGAYQETLGDIHNLFGDTDAVNVRLGPGGNSYQLSNWRRGDTTDALLDYVGYDLQALRKAYRDKIVAAELDDTTAANLRAALEQGLTGYTYLEERREGE